MSYKVIPHNEQFLGKGYVDWIEDWTRWLFLPKADQNNSGSVVFLRGMSDKGVTMIGNDALDISISQRVLLPMITATAVAESGESSQTLYELVRSDIDNGDHPPAKENVRVDNADFIVHDLDKYRFETRVFQLNIPSSPYGESIADYVVPPIKTRDTNLPCVTAGYFVLLEFVKEDKYEIFSSVRGSRDQTGSYNASLFYHISVGAPRGPPAYKPGNPVPPISNRAVANFKAAFRKKYKDGEIDGTEFGKLRTRFP